MQSKASFMEKTIRDHRKLIITIILVVFGILFGMVSIVNHLNYRTYGLDLGVYNKAIYDYGHLRISDCSIFLYEPGNLMGDHMDLYLFIFAPLHFIFGQYTLLIVQILSVLFGALGVYRLLKLYTDKEWIAIGGMLILLLQFGVWHAIGFDYHSNVVAAMLLPWLLAAIKRKRYWQASLWLVGMIISKETTPLWLIFVLVALMWDYRKDRKAMLWLSGATLGCIVYLTVVTLVIMPAIGSNTQVLWRYDYMGNGFGAMAKWMVTHSGTLLQNFFTNFTGDADYNGIKLELAICLLTSGGLLALMKPNYLFMLIPPLGLKMLARDANAFWGISYQYNIEICMVIAIAAGLALTRLKEGRIQKAATVAAMLLTATTLIYTVSNPKTIIRKYQVRVYDSRHWRQKDLDIKAVKRMLNKIPSDASVCATTLFTPHLAMRDSIYLFPCGLSYNPEYFLIMDEFFGYYKSDDYDEAAMAKETINDTAKYELLDHDGPLFLLRAKKQKNK